jgi:D-proline reductase (dithiol) PrdB
VVRLSDLPDWDRQHIENADLPTFADRPWTPPPAAADRRVAIVTTAGLHRRGDRPFAPGAGDYRVIPGDLPAGDLVMSHVSTNFDRLGFQDDLNVVFPIDRLRSLAAAGAIGSVADFHYAFMGGGTHPDWMRDAATDVAGLLREDAVNAVLLVPV